MSVKVEDLVGPPEASLTPCFQLSVEQLDDLGSQDRECWTILTLGLEGRTLRSGRNSRPKLSRELWLAGVFALPEALTTLGVTSQCLIGKDHSKL